MAIDGTRIVVGDLHAAIGATDSGAAVVYDLAGPEPTRPAITLINPQPFPNAYFGFSVGISGPWVVVGMVNGEAPSYHGSAYVYNLAGGTPDKPVTKLTDPTAPASDGFGWAVAISGARVVIGAPSYGLGGNNEGRSLVFDLSSATPDVPVAVLADPTPVSQGLFGLSVAISGARVVVAGQAGLDPWFDDKIAYLYDLGGATPTVPEIGFVNPGPSGFFVPARVAVAINGSRAVIGAESRDSGYLYDVSSALPEVPIAALYGFSLAANDQFGQAVAIAGKWVAVGTPLADGGAGAVYAYDLTSATSSTPALTLHSPNPRFDERFGADVAISGTRVAVGVLEDDRTDSDGACAYVFDLARANPSVPLVTLINPDRRSDDDSTSRVDISGTRIVVGNVPGQGREALVYVYDLGSERPAFPTSTLTNPGPADFFEIDVSISGTRIAVGESGIAYTSDGTLGTGLVRVFDLANPRPTVPVVTLTDPNPAGHALFGCSVDLEGTRPAIGTTADSPGGQALDRVCVFDLGSTTPTIPVLTLTNPTPAAQRFGVSVAWCDTRLVVGAASVRTAGPNSAGAYVYDLASDAPAIPVATLNLPSHAGDDLFGVSVAMDSAGVIVGSPFDDTNGFDRGAAYVFVPRPVLSISHIARHAALLSWSSPVPGFVLQYSDSLAPGSWVNAPGSATAPVMVSATNASRFYRLFQP